MSQPAGVAVQESAPAGLRSKTTVATPEAEPLTSGSAELLVSATGGMPISAPFGGAVMLPVGSVLSMRIVIAPDVKELPALSVVTTRRSYWPSA